MRDFVGCRMSEPFEAQDKLKLRPPKDEYRLTATPGEPILPRIVSQLTGRHRDPIPLQVHNGLSRVVRGLGATTEALCD